MTLWRTTSFVHDLSIKFSLNATALNTIQEEVIARSKGKVKAVD